MEEECEMTVIEIGELMMAKGTVSGMVIEATRGELQEVEESVLYKEVEVKPLRKSQEDFWNEAMEKLVERLCDVDKRVRGEKASRKFTRDEVLALLDEIDPSKTDEEKGDE